MRSDAELRPLYCGDGYQDVLAGVWRSLAVSVE
jgi:hypothetical protein